MQRAKLVIGSRASKLALLMAEEVRKNLLLRYPFKAEEISILPLQTKGDALQESALADFGGKGLFTETIETALLKGEIDIAVHSAKDMPSFLPDGLHIAGYLKREDPRDVFVGTEGKSFFDLPKGARLGTASLRRQALAKRARPDLDIVLLRGNVETRLAKVAKGLVEGTFLAVSGLKRLGLSDYLHYMMPIKDFLPAPGQGAICLETRQDDSKINEWCRAVCDKQTGIMVSAERHFLSILDGSCRTPLGAYATSCSEGLAFEAIILQPNGEKVFNVRLIGKQQQAHSLAEEAAIILRRKAGEDFFASWKK